VDAGYPDSSLYLVHVRKAHLLESVAAPSPVGCIARERTPEITAVFLADECEMESGERIAEMVERAVPPAAERVVPADETALNELLQ
jgi:hypothetical protein